MLVSFPSLTYMLKFSELTCLRSDWPWYSIHREQYNHSGTHTLTLAIQGLLGLWCSMCMETASTLVLWRGDQLANLIDIEDQLPLPQATTIQTHNELSSMHESRSNSRLLSACCTSQCVSQFAALFLEPRT